MNEELEKLIDLALADGMLADKEKQVLFKKARALNVDQDEFEMVLEAKLYLAQKGTTKATVPPPQLTQERPLQPKSDKYGEIKKCPACGAMITSFSTSCKDCGHDFQYIEATNSIRKLFEQLNEIESHKSEDSPFGVFKAFGTAMSKHLGVDNKITSQKKSMISNFPIPNTKQDIIEFLSLAFPKAKIAGNFITKNQGENAVHNEFVPVWKAKCEQLIIKARFAMKDDKKTLEEIEYYGKELGIK